MKHGRSRAFQPGVECLEDRSLMAAHLNATLSAGLLRVDGTPGADHIVIRQQGNRISVDNISINIRGQGNVSSVSASQVKRIDVRGLEGNDIIEVGGDETHGSNALVKPVWIWGGAGNDRIYGSQGDDKIHADAGNDQVYGRGGNDTIDGDAGNDKLDGGDGNDTLRGGDGYDSLWGGAGNDKLDGGTGNDQLWGGAGNDQLNGGVGSNHLLGEAGDDVINSNSHHDTIDGGAGRNLIYFLAGTPTPSSAGATARSSAAVSTPSAPSGPFAADVNELIARTNAYRASKRLPTLTVDARLTKAAQYQADYMARTGHYDHVNLDGRALENRVQATGYRYSLIAENIHLYDPAVRRTLGLSRIFSLNELAEYYLDGWIVSPGHNANLLLKTVKNVGVGIAQDRNGLVYVSMVLGQH